MIKQNDSNSLIVLRKVMKTLLYVRFLIAAGLFGAMFGAFIGIWATPETIFNTSVYTGTGIALAAAVAHAFHLIGDWHPRG